MRFVLDVSRDAEGRLSGQIRWEGAARPVAFSGTLELLRILEDHTDPGNEHAPVTATHE